MKTKLFIFLVIGIWLNTGCKKNDSNNDSNNNNNNNNNTTSTYYIHGTLAGSSLQVDQVGTSGYQSGMLGGSESAQNPNLCLHSQGSSFSNPFASGVPEYYIGIYKVFPQDANQECTLTNAEYESILHTGAIAFAATSTEEGAFIHYVDATGMYWSTEAGSQTGSTFTIDSYTTDNTGLAPKIAKYTFSCKLYDDNANVKTFSATWNGRAIAYF